MKEYNNGDLLRALAKAILLTVPESVCKEDPEKLALELSLIRPISAESGDKYKVNFIPTSMGMKILDECTRLLLTAQVASSLAKALFPDIVKSPGNESDIKPNPDGYDIKGHDEKVDFDQVINMQRVRDLEAFEELSAMARERAQEVVAEMRKGIKSDD